MIKNLTLITMGSSLFAVPYGMITLGRRETRMKIFAHAREMIFLLIWVLPAFGFLAVVFFEQPGYVLNISPAIYIFFGYCIVTLSEKIKKEKIRATIVWIQVGILCGLQSILFLSPPAFHFGSAIGKAYEEKTWTESLVSMAYTSFYRHTHDQIVRDDSTTSSYVRAVRELPYSPQELTLVMFHRSFWNIKLASYYLPEYEAYILPDWRTRIDKVWKSRNRELTEYEPPHSFRLSPSTKALAIFCDERSPSYREIAGRVNLRKVIIDDARYFFLIEGGTIMLEYQHITFTNKE
jgi:hypothetical protein